MKEANTPRLPRLGKRGVFSPEQLWKYYIEYLALLFCLLGFLLALVTGSAVLSYISAFLAGIYTGKVYYVKKKTDPYLGTMLIIIGFVLGFVIGTFTASRILVLVLFVVGSYLSFKLHEQGKVKYGRTRLFSK